MYALLPWGAAYLPDALTSIAQQRGVRLQVILLDDQSPDDSLAAARREDYQSGGGYEAGLEYFVDVEKCLRMMGEHPAWFIAEPLAGFRVHRGAASFCLQGDAYREFLEIERRFQRPHLPRPRRGVRQLQAGLDSLLRLIFYRIWG